MVYVIKLKNLKLMTNDFFQSMVLELELTRCVENRRMCLLTAV